MEAPRRWERDANERRRMNQKIDRKTGEVSARLAERVRMRWDIAEALQRHEDARRYRASLVE